MLHPERYKPGCDVLAIGLLADVVHTDRHTDRETSTAQTLQEWVTMQTGIGSHADIEQTVKQVRTWLRLMQTDRQIGTGRH